MIFSYGGGVQSNAALVFAARRVIDCKRFLFGYVGDDSENPTTLKYIREIAIPFADRHGIHIIELNRFKNGKYLETLISRVCDTEHSIPIPVRMFNGAPGNRSCTIDFKIKVIAEWCRELGCTKQNPMTTGIGFTIDEAHRVNSGKPIPYMKKIYPLIDLNLNRSDCIKIILDAGLPVPQKSACWFCPFHRISEWRHMKRDDPEMFKAAAELERFINARRIKHGKDEVYFTQYGITLNRAVPEIQEGLQSFDECKSECDSGYCST